jgi:hypothetical protein
MKILSLSGLFFTLSTLCFNVYNTYATPTVAPATAAPTVAPIPPNCNIILPPFPLSYQGLITPYQLQTIDPNTPCAMKTFPAFAEALIFDLDTNSLSIYHPLIVDFQTNPLVQPLPFVMPTNNMVAIHFGSNGMAIKLFPPLSVQQGNCVYGIGGTTSLDQFGQFSHCNAVAFFEKIKALILKNVPLHPPIPELGTASDGMPCPTTRDFFLVDMDPSDNVVTTYLVDMATGKTAQNSFANQQANPQAVVIKNGSDNLLLSNLDKIMGCKPYQVPNLVDLNNPMNAKISSLALDEIHAAVRQEKTYAYLPKGDPMTRVMVAGAMQPNLVKLNLYRQGAFQPMVIDLIMADTTAFCMHFTEAQVVRLQKNKGLFINQPSPDLAISPHMFGFLANRFSASYNGLNCQFLLDLPNPVTLMMANNLVADAVFSQLPTFTPMPGDPYLISWDEYPAFTPEPMPPTAVPTTEPPSTPMPSTPMPSFPSYPNTTNQNINNVDPAPGGKIMSIIAGASTGALVLVAVGYYCYRKTSGDERAETLNKKVVYDHSIKYQSLNEPEIVISSSKLPRKY